MTEKNPTNDTAKEGGRSNKRSTNKIGATKSKVFEEKSLDQQHAKIMEALKVGSAHTTTQWIQRKEISAWTALAFYLLISWQLIQLSIGDSDFKLALTYVLYSNLILCVPFILFIYSQYAVIYHNHAYTLVQRKISFDQIRSGKDNFDVLKYADDIADPQKIDEEIKAAKRKYVHTYTGWWYPIKIILCSILYFTFKLPPFSWLKYLSKVRPFPWLTGRLKIIRPTNFEIQEASLYMILFLPIAAELTLIRFPHLLAK